MNKYDKGCPCGNDCCDEPDTCTPDHICGEDFCEECYVVECMNCGDSCGCEL